jgi:alanyl-tRNA synthetase
MIKINNINRIKFNNIKFSKFSTYSILNKEWTSENIRTEFINYFKNLNYTPVPSASLIPPQSDKSLLFINAGMVPLKQHFINPASAPYPNMVSVQRCVRAGGKDNDLEQVGFTKRHLTMFEMLGSFSFGQVDPVTKLNQVWKFLTENLELDKERLRIRYIMMKHTINKN